jgi:hypothetical protein
VAPLGTGTLIEIPLQFVGVPVVPLNVTVLVPSDEPKFAPVIVTDVPTTPPPGDRLLMLGSDDVTVKSTPLLFPPPTVTTRSPVVAPAGTATVIDVLVELVGLAVTWGLKTTWGVRVPPAVKLLPVIVNDAPTGPDVSDRPVTTGDGLTVKLLPLLDAVPTLTTTLPKVAPEGTWTDSLVELQETHVTRVPLNVTVLVPCDVPKPVPTITTNAPTGPACGVITLMTGAANAGAIFARMTKAKNTAELIALCFRRAIERTNAPKPRLPCPAVNFIAISIQFVNCLVRRHSCMCTTAGAQLRPAAHTTGLAQFSKLRTYCLI